MSTYALFDLEARIDKSLLRACRYPQLEANADGDEQAFRFECATLREKQNLQPSELPFLPLQWHRPISLAVAIITEPDYELTSVETMLADQLPIATDFERELVIDFWRRAEAFRSKKGTFVTFNGRSYDFAVLELAALKYGVAIPIHLGEKYGARYRFQSDAHFDLLKFVGNYGATYPPRGGLGWLLEFLGLPGKNKTTGAGVQALYEAGRLEDIHKYCRNDVRRLYQLFLHVQAWRGQIDATRASELACAVKMEDES